MSTFIKKVVPALLGQVSILAVLILWSSHRTRTEAEELLAEFRKLDLETATVSEVKAIAARFGGGPTSDVYTDRDCTVQVRITNRFLYYMGLAPLAKLGVYAEFHNGRIGHIAWSLKSYSLKGYVPAQAIVLYQGCYPCESVPEPYSVGGNIIALTVHLSPASAPTQREDALAFNLDCLTKFDGCPDARDLIPTIGETQRERRR